MFPAYRHASLRGLLALAALLPAAASAVQAAPTAEQANAAYRRAIEADAARSSTGRVSLMTAALLESMKIRAVRGCQRFDDQHLACIVQVDGGMRSGYQTYLFAAQGTDWRIGERKDPPVPAPSLGEAQRMLREGLSLDSERQENPERRALFAQAATTATVESLESCDLDRDSGAVECLAQMDLPDGKNSAQMRFALNNGQWTLLPR